MIGISARHNRAEHDWLVGLVLEISIVELVELGAHLLEFFLGGSNLKQGPREIQGYSRKRLESCLKSCIDGVRR